MIRRVTLCHKQRLKSVAWTVDEAVMRPEPRTRLRRCLLVLRAHHNGTRRLDRRRMVQLTCMGMSVAGAAQAASLGDYMRAMSNREENARREIEEAGKVVRTLLANTGIASVSRAASQVA